VSRIVVVGGGWAGCAAAVAARQAGAEVVLLERTDMLLGTGLVGGIMDNNGRLSAAWEGRALGAGALFALIDATVRHKLVEFPGHRHASLYDVNKIEPLVATYLKELGIQIRLTSRAVDVEMSGRRIAAVITSQKEKFEADAFVEATGTAGPAGNCHRFDSGCVMCILRCPTFGPRVSIAAKAGVVEDTGHLYDALSGSCKLRKASLATWVVERLERDGVLLVPIPKFMADEDLLRKKACQQYNLREFASNLVLLDTGSVKLMAPFFPLEKLRSIRGFENAKFEDPYSGGRGNSVRYSLITPRDNYMQVEGLDNLFCAGEKGGLMVGHTEAIITGTLAGHNAVRKALGMPLLKLPRSLACGDFIAFVRDELTSCKEQIGKYTFAGSIYFQRMRELGLYTTDLGRIERRVRKSGLEGVFARPLESRKTS
jgi:hypothetical protein